MTHCPSPRTKGRESARPRLRDDKGFVLVLNALFLTVMISLGGFAVDLGNWYLHALRLQRAADAAALSGSVFLPGDPAAAVARAQTSLTANGLGSVQARIRQSTTKPTELEVTLSENVQNSFIQLLGMKSLAMARTATGEYRPYVPMGSPSNILGIEPDSNTWEKTTQIGRQSHYWLNIAGGNTFKGNGDRYSGNNCTQGGDRCNTGPAVPNGNLDYSPDGQFYVVRVPQGVSGTLQIQAFDAGFAYVNDSCTQNTLDGANAYSPAATPNLYASGNNSVYCTGDQSTDTSQPVPATTYRLYTPEDSLGGSKAITAANCGGVTYNGFNGNIANRVNPSSGSYNATFAGWFRKWTPICTLSIGPNYPAGDYLLRVSTTLNSNGLNRFALRTAIMTSPTATTINTSVTSKLSLFAKGRLVVYAHENTGDVMFYLARIHSGAAGSDLTVTLYDIGDAAGGANLYVVPPTEATNNGFPLSTFAGCSYTPPGSTSFQTTGAGCGIANLNSNQYNGRIVNIRVPVPVNYACNDASTEGCWTRLRIVYGAGSVQDTTSWEVSLNGQPLHLVVNNDD